MERNMMVVFASLCFVAYVLYMLILVIPVFAAEAWVFLIKKVRKLRVRIERWNKWRKLIWNGQGVLYKLLVLLGLRKSPSFDLVLTGDEIKSMIGSHKEEMNDDIG